MGACPLSQALIGLSGVLNDVIQIIDKAYDNENDHKRPLNCLDEISDIIRAHKADASSIQAHFAGAVQVKGCPTHSPVPIPLSFHFPSWMCKICMQYAFKYLESLFPRHNALPTIGQAFILRSCSTWPCLLVDILNWPQPLCRTLSALDIFQVEFELEPPTDSESSIKASGLFLATSSIEHVVDNMSPTLSPHIRNLASRRNTRQSGALHLELVNSSPDCSLHRFIDPFATATLQDLLAFSTNPCKLELRLLFNNKPLYLDHLISNAASMLPSSSSKMPTSRVAHGLLTATEPFAQTQVPALQKGTPPRPPLFSPSTAVEPAHAGPPSWSAGVQWVDADKLQGTPAHESALAANGHLKNAQHSPARTPSRGKPVSNVLPVASPIGTQQKDMVCVSPSLESVDVMCFVHARFG